ncbi:unnamed protein product [Euphydryas editha]|uniref:Transposase n=1 Tax=Euphydryas editha TaxID=104508 RepID=A0AAU9UU29_EUPED|nr:unnamed protein product [Euphydryas editha]
MTQRKRKQIRKQITIEEKSRIISKLENGIPNKDLAAEYGVPHSTISTIWKERQKIQKLFKKNLLKMKRARTTKHTKIEDALLKWYKYQRANNVPINGPILQQKANDFAQSFGEDFVCSSSWIQRFRARHGIVGGKMSGEGDIGIHLQYRNNGEFDESVKTRKSEQEKKKTEEEPEAEDGDLWTYFEKESSSTARCVLCLHTMATNNALMRKHLKEKHSKLNGEEENDTEDSNNDEQNLTEVVYIENEDQTKQDAKRKSSVSQTQTKKRRTETDGRTEHDEDEEIENFGKYITSLLKSIPRDLCTKLQMDIINLIMTTKLNKMATTSNASYIVSLPSSNSNSFNDVKPDTL